MGKMGGENITRLEATKVDQVNGMIVLSPPEVLTSFNAPRSNCGNSPAFVHALKTDIMWSMQGRKTVVSFPDL